MRRRLQISIAVVVVLLITIFSSFIIGNGLAAEAPQGNDVNLVLDLQDGNDSIPRNFRKTTDLLAVKDNKRININGLSQLNVSGSHQFSEYNLKILIKAIGTSLPITVVDLRQESHGFINGLPVSWVKDSKNNANDGLTKQQVLVDEANILNSIKLYVPITFYNLPNETIIPVKVQSENQLVKAKSLSYNRITVEDGRMPSDDMVDYFVEYVNAQPKNSWLHFHCKEGIGRTTTFMIMYDMMHSCKEVSADDIINRQVALANLDKDEEKSFYSIERIRFLNRFYDYCKNSGDSFKVKWSEWKVQTYSELSKETDNQFEGANKEKKNLESSLTSNPTAKTLEVPVLMYHSINTKSTNNLIIKPQEFEKQISWLKDNGFTPLFLDELYSILTTGKGVPQKPIAITLDDGYEDNYTEAYPILKKYNFKATIFLITSAIGHATNLKENQIKEMYANNIDFQSHTVSHHELNSLSYKKQLEELINSREAINKMLNKNTDYLAYPIGKYNEDTLKALKASGYKMAFTTKPGWSKLSDGLYRSRRVRMYPGMSMQQFGH